MAPGPLATAEEKSPSFESGRPQTPTSWNSSRPPSSSGSSSPADLCPFPASPPPPHATGGHTWKLPQLTAQPTCPFLLQHPLPLPPIPPLHLPALLRTLTPSITLPLPAAFTSAFNHSLRSPAKKKQQTSPSLIPHPLQLFLLLHGHSSQENYLHCLTPFPHPLLTPRPTPIWLPRASLHGNGSLLHDFHTPGHSSLFSPHRAPPLGPFDSLGHSLLLKARGPWALQSPMLLPVSEGSFSSSSLLSRLRPGAPQGLVLCSLHP